METSGGDLFVKECHGFNEARLCKPMLNIVVVLPQVPRQMVEFAQKRAKPFAAGFVDAMIDTIVMLRSLPQFGREAFEQILPANGLLLTDSWT